MTNHLHKVLRLQDFDANTVGTDADVQPFCCARTQVYNSRRTAYDAAFNNFANATGNALGLVFCVNEHVGGPMIKYFTLADGVRSEVAKPVARKIHPHRNYNCTACKRRRSTRAGARRRHSSHFTGIQLTI